MKPGSAKGYGWRKDRVDTRDMIFRTTMPAAILPSKVDLRLGCPPVYDQGDLGSCTANAIAAALDFERKKQKESFINPSRLFIYYNERVMEGDPLEDNGAEIRDGIKSVAKQGGCPEAEWPYDVSQFAVKPGLKCYADALKYRSIGYKSVPQTKADTRGCLAQGFPFVFGFLVFDSFESDAVAANGVVPMPGMDEEIIGGHAVLCVGYDDATQRFLCRNSWNTDWGMAGYFTIPYNYILNRSLAGDLWTIRAVM